MKNYACRIKVIEKRIPRKRPGDTRVWLCHEDGTRHSRGEILTEAEFNERYKQDEIISLWFSDDE